MEKPTSLPQVEPSLPLLAGPGLIADVADELGHALGVGTTTEDEHALSRTTAATHTRSDTSCVRVSLRLASTER
jgi:hypothetical protein